jgi:hypothetical protein
MQPEKLPPSGGRAVTGYCHSCGTYAILGPAAMCGACRRAWQPAVTAPADLGYRAQPNPRDR